MATLDFNDAYIVVDEDRNILVMRKLGALPPGIEKDNTLSFAEKQELKPVENVFVETQLSLTEEGKKLLAQLKEIVITKDAGSNLNQPGRYYFHPQRVKELKDIISNFSQSE
ncbi:MAG: hypothetical protein LWW94_01355 [Candidatus Desulfofervidaceae bacterium]|nr:hypothetical protein [Candidatus Desulfofervidaceae bacterium]